jgi:hypothetical protein
MRGPLGNGWWNNLGDLFGRRWRTPEQRMNSATVEQEEIKKVLSKQDARYDSMTEEEREKYYMKPSLMTKLKKALRGQ